MRKILLLSLLSFGTTFAENDIVFTDDSIVMKNFQNLQTIVVNDKADRDSVIMNEKVIIMNNEREKTYEEYYREYYQNYQNQR